MRALCWYGKEDVRVERVSDPKILNPHDAIVRITTTAICGSDLHLYGGFVPAMEEGDILGHEFMGEVVEVGSEVKNLKKGDRVVVPFTIACGRCFFCEHKLWSACDNTNPNAYETELETGYPGPGLFGYSHANGGYAGGQAEYARVPFADVGPLKIPDGIPDEKVIFLSDIFPTGYQAAENCNITAGDTVAVWGCGPVGQFAIRSAFLLGAERVIAIDDVPERLEMARQSGAHTITGNGHTFEDVKEATGGMGPDACIDAVGLEAHGSTLDAKLDKAKMSVKLATDRANVLREAIHCCRKGGTVSVPGVYMSAVDKFPFGMAFAKGVNIRMGQTQVQNYMRPLLKHIEDGDIDPSFVITHRLNLNDAPEGYRTFREKHDKCIKVVLNP
ncbi:MAG TPA: zinc-dependent alcohol dehydrogenase [Verrucomicrobiae bacterium]|jgi:threonine dehydrogenase-like Zn-dependent dehydrogenase|nr:zinc-dependent alcohol dehydrogenase [Verrucomicrobiae bacterium]